MAASTGSFSGQAQYRYSDAELDEDLQPPTVDIAGPPDANGNLTGPDGKIDAFDCPIVSDSSQPNLCLLDQATIEAMTSTSTTADDGGLGGNTSAATPADPITGAVASGNEKSLAQQILANPNITFDFGPTGRIAKPFTDLAAGNKASTLDAAPATDVDVIILQILLQAAQNHKVNVSSLTTGHAVGDVHSIGKAVDVNIFDGVHLSGRDPKSLEYIKTVISLMPSGSKLGQIDCGPGVAVVPSNIIQFTGDSCNHVHISVP
jgi:hypothetical protein